MKRITCLIALSVLLASGTAHAVAGGVDPSYVKIKVYEIRISPNDDCTNGITVFRDASPALTDMTNGPTLGSGAIPNGTYNCVMIHMSDAIHYTPVTTTGAHAACVAGTDYTLDVAHDQNGVNPDGSTNVFGAAGTDNQPWLYIRRLGTVATGNNNINAWVPTEGINMTTPMVVTGDRSQTMVFNFSSQVSEQSNNGGAPFTCNCEAPVMSFR